jgi:choline dehydrogenase-like flavoprotein
MFFLYALPASLRVLIVEKGPVIPWDAQIRVGGRPEDDIPIKNLSGQAKSWTAHSLFGGNSNCWWGQTPRMHPSDFRLNSLYGVGVDWPFDYDTLEPFYMQAEQIMQVAGGGTDPVFPRSGPYPFPPHVLSRSDQVLTKWRPDMWVPAPNARSNGGDRAPCCANGICAICPIDSKFSVMNGVAAFDRPTAFLLPDTECRGIETEGGAATAMLVQNASTETRLTGQTFALATNAVFNAAILLRSGLGGAATGRYLHEQASVSLAVDVAQKNYFGGTAITSHCYGAYDGPHRRGAGGVLIENFNVPHRLRPERGRWTDRMHLKLIAEEIPQADNRVMLDKDGRAVTEWHGHAAYAERGLERAEAMLQDLMPFEVERIAERVVSETEAHIQGTHRMGVDPEHSVTDPSMRLHGVDNLFVLGSGAFPSCSPANPTLTLSALSLRAGGMVA